MGTTSRRRAELSARVQGSCSVDVDDHVLPLLSPPPGTVSSVSWLFKAALRVLGSPESGVIERQHTGVAKISGTPLCGVSALWSEKNALDCGCFCDLIMHPSPVQTSQMLGFNVCMFGRCKTISAGRRGLQVAPDRAYPARQE